MTREEQKWGQTHGGTQKSRLSLFYDCKDHDVDSTYSSILPCTIYLRRALACFASFLRVPSLFLALGTGKKWECDYYCLQ